MTGSSTKAKQAAPARPKQSQFFSSYSEFNTPFGKSDSLAIPKEVRDFARENDADVRWINSNEYSRVGGYHPSRWVPLDLKRANITLAGIAHGVQADNVIRRGDLILAVRPKSVSREHKALLAKRASAIQGGVQRKASKALQEVVGADNDAVTILEGYDD